MIKIIIILMLLTVGWYGNILYTKNELPFIHSTSSSISIDDKIKCITKDGRILYGIVPEGTVCEKRESVKASIVILSSETKAKGDNTTNPSKNKTIETRSNF